MSTLLIVIGFFAAYFGIGYRAAVWNVPRASAIAHDKWAIVKDIENESQYMQFVFMVLGWPVYFTAIVLKTLVVRAVENNDPRAIEAKAAHEFNKQKAIESKLVIDEYELDIGDHSSSAIREAKYQILKYKYPKAYDGSFSSESDNNFMMNSIIPIYYRKQDISLNM